VRSCQIPVGPLAGIPILTIEGLSKSGDHILQKLWVEMNVPQCGYCQSGILMAAAALLRQVERPTDEQIDASVSNICRCGTYPRVRAAIHRASGTGSREPA
jgi:isoquinoline 1-oxidoreductase alpha subunit